MPISQKLLCQILRNNQFQLSYKKKKKKKEAAIAGNKNYVDEVK
jgi:hypothetical protein